MSQNSHISWTDTTWNSIIGCARCSSGCAACYAIRDAWRLGHNPNSKVAGAYKGLVEKHVNGKLDWTGEIRFLPERLTQPLHWTKPRRIFVNSMSDLFHEDVQDAWLDQMFAVMALTPQHTYQCLTKRPERMYAYMQTPDILERLRRVRILDKLARSSNLGQVFNQWPLPNVWLGVSVENRAALNRLNLLCEVPAAVHFASFEPLLEDLGDITPWLEPVLNAAGIDQAILGGESGPQARPCHTDWIRSLISQCNAAGVACFVKQLGSFAVYEREVGTAKGGSPVLLSLRDRKGADPSEWPDDLRVQEFPRETAHV